MNIVLLILGVVIIVFSTFLITLNSSKTQDKIPESTFETYSPKPNIKNSQRETGENLFYEKIRDEVLESPIRKTNIKKVEPVEQKIVTDFKVEENLFEQEVIRENIIVEDIIATENEEYTEDREDTVNLTHEAECKPIIESQKKLSITDADGNITDKIIRMKQEGMSDNEIAKSLNKGVREIEIILKINKINN